MPGLTPSNERKVCKLISEARLSSMGLLMLIIMLFHNQFGVLGAWGRFIALYGHWAVDAFLFLSGFGLFFALNKERDYSVKRYLLRRFVRIVPAAAIAGTVIYLCGFSNHLGVLGLNLWYIRTILILYLLSPFIYKSLTKWNPTVVALVYIIISFVLVMVSVPLLIKSSFVWKSTVCWTFARVPAFVIGMYVARMDFELKKLLHPAYIVFVIACLVAALHFHEERAALKSMSTYLHLLPYTLVAFSLPLIITLFGCAKSYIKGGGIESLLVFLGTYSLELYLVHEAIFKYVAKNGGAPEIKFLSAYGASVVSAIALNSIVHNIVSKGSKYS